ncbi:MAG: YlmC/YmxH family sporulation protein [Firmicutes bacterium]|nr:YlmC/YmxH family sporulation protein [Bacillota bacterium]
MFLISELRRKDVINEIDGKKLGYVYDIEIDINSGAIDAVIIPGESRFLGFFVRSEETIIPWDKIKKIGLDVILIGEERAKPIVTDIIDTPVKEISPLQRKEYDWEEWEL